MLMGLFFFTSYLMIGLGIHLILMMFDPYDYRKHMSDDMDKLISIFCWPMTAGIFVISFFVFIVEKVSNALANILG